MQQCWYVYNVTVEIYRNLERAIDTSPVQKVIYRIGSRREDKDIAPNAYSWSTQYGQKVETKDHLES